MKYVDEKKNTYQPMPGGQFINGKLTGNGHISFANGDRYQGSFKDGF